MGGRSGLRTTQTPNGVLIPPLPPPTKPAPRQARALHTRNQLIAAGRDAFALLGHDGVNLAKDILEPSGVSVGSFYHQFADKTELLIVIMQEAGDLRRRAVIGLGLRDAATLQEGIRWAYEFFFDSLDSDTHAWRIQLHERSSSNERVRDVAIAGRSTWIRELTTVLATWSGTENARREQAATNMVGHSMGLAVYYLDLPKTERTQRRAELIEGAIAFATTGLTAMLEVEAEP